MPDETVRRVHQALLAALTEAERDGDHAAVLNISTKLLEIDAQLPGEHGKDVVVPADEWAEIQKMVAALRARG